MKLFMDMEFTGLHQNTSLISIGIVSEDSNCFYGERTDFNKSQLERWHYENVLPHLKQYKPDEIMTEDNVNTVIGSGDILLAALKPWLNQYKEIEIWSDCLAYDWVLFCQLFGGAMSVPKNIHYIPYDICTLFKAAGIDPDINREEFANIKGPKHNALHDAKVIRACYEKLAVQFPLMKG